MSSVRFALAAIAATAAMTGVAWSQPAQPAPAPTPAPAKAAPAPAAKAQAPLSEGVAAIVNDEIISTYDLRQRVLLVLVTNGVQPTEANLREIEREALRAIVDERLELQEIKHVQEKNKDVHLDASPKDVDQEMTEIAAQYNVKLPAFLDTLRNAGIDPQTLRNQIAVRIAWQTYIGGRFHSNVRIGQDRLNQEEARINASATKTQYQVSEIFVDDQRAGGHAQAMTGAAQLVDQMKKGAPFAAVARQFSSLPTSTNGGDAGWLTSGEVAPAMLEPVLANMRPGQLSDPVQASDGVYILQLRDKRAGAGATLISLKQAAVRLGADATPEQLASADAKLQTLRAEYKDCATLEAKAAKVNDVVAGDLGETEISDLSPEFHAVVDKLKVGQISEPVRTRAGLHLVALCGRRASGGRVPTKDEIEGRLENDQLAMIARRFLRDLRNSATIESR